VDNQYNTRINQKAYTCSAWGKRRKYGGNMVVKETFKFILNLIDFFLASHSILAMEVPFVETKFKHN
jgi:hypothetical protein